jgi:hypothetical protein
LGWLWIRFHDLFLFGFYEIILVLWLNLLLICFFFYEVISVSWLKLWVNLIDSSFFCIFLNDFFFNFILQHWVDYELGLMIYFCLVSMRLSWSYDLIYFWFAFYEVISVSWLKSWVNLIDSSFFCIFLNDFFFQFYPSTFGWLWIRPHNLFWFALYEVILILWLGSRVSWVDPCRLWSFYCVMFS